VPDPPTAFLASFGDNGMVLELGVLIADPENGQLNLKSALNREILKAFGKNDIRLPFPQREVRIIGMPPSSSLPVKPVTPVTTSTLVPAPPPGPKLAS
jgi:small-conductance mechanosensitive channel